MASSKKESARWQVLYTVSSCVRKWGIKKTSCPLHRGRRRKGGSSLHLCEHQAEAPAEEAVCQVVTFKRTLVAVWHLCLMMSSRIEVNGYYSGWMLPFPCESACWRQEGETDLFRETLAFSSCLQMMNCSWKAMYVPSRWLVNGPLLSWFF